MKLSAALSPLGDLKLALKHALIPVFKDIFSNPRLLLRPAALSRVFMAHVWVAFANATDEGGRVVKSGLLTPHARGVVLDIGAGHGHTVNYLDHNQVTRYIALEPNTLMHPLIRQLANTAGFTESDGTLVILTCGAEDAPSILTAIGPQSVDTLVSILTMCSIPSPERTLSRLVRDILKPGGQLLFYEHVLSPRRYVAWWQHVWSPIWRIAFDGCRLDCPTHIWIESMTDVDPNGKRVSTWGESHLWGKEGEPEEHLFWHRVGKFVKRRS